MTHKYYEDNSSNDVQSKCFVNLRMNKLFKLGIECRLKNEANINKNE